MVANDENGTLFVLYTKLNTQLYFLGRLLLFQGIKVISFMLGFFLTLGFLGIMYGDLAITKLFKGISIQNFINIIEEMNISELAVIFYFIGLFVLFYLLNYSIKKFNLFSQLSQLQQSTIFGILVYFREGIFTLPFIIMIVFPLLLQVILPILIVFVAFGEVVFPFILMGELYSSSKGNFLKIIHSKTKSLYNIGGSLFAYPLGVLFLVISGLDKFLNLVHFHLLWENPESWIAPALWSGVNQLIVLLSFGVEGIFSFLSNSKYFAVTFLVLVITSELYLIARKIFQTYVTPRLSSLVLTYD